MGVSYSSYYTPSKVEDKIKLSRYVSIDRSKCPELIHRLQSFRADRNNSNNPSLSDALPEDQLLESINAYLNNLTKEQINEQTIDDAHVSSGWTALMAAVDPLVDSFPFFKQLIEHGADVNLQNKNGQTVLMMIVNASKDSGFHNTISMTDKNGGVGEFVKPYRLTCVSRMICKSETSSYDSYEYCELLDYGDLKHYTLCLEAVNLLLSSNANIHLVDQHGRNALMYAVYSSDNLQVFQIIKTLIKAGIDINATDNFGCTALDIALASNNSKQIIDYLLTAGAKRNVDLVYSKEFQILNHEIKQLQQEINELKNKN